MPVTAIPFKSPPPFALPDHLKTALGQLPFEQAAQQVLELLLDAGCADLMLMGLAGADGRLRPGPYLGLDGRLAGIGQRVEEELARRDLALDTDAGRADFMGQAIHGGQPLLMMGEVAEGEPDPFPAAFRQYLLAGQPRHNIGFLYVFPLAAGRGALVLHRPLPTGPLNHDQPAITQALVDELGAIAPSRAGA